VIFENLRIAKQCREGHTAQGNESTDMTLAEKAYGALRHDIIRGTFQAEQPLRLADLKERYDMGFSPLREALNRLQAERLVVAEALRGFKVASLSVAELQDATRTRIMIESEALRMAIAQGDDAWASKIVSALYSLNVQAARSGADKDVWELESRHHAFHRALLEGCGSDWLLEFFERLYAATERYRIPILIGTDVPTGRDIQAEHSALADAVIGRNAELAVALLRDHYTRTADTILDLMDRSKPKRR
jgi:DNA-binding GntR family transcriptional regulator